MEPIKPEVATREDAELKLKEVCDVCQKPLAKGNSGSISMWLFKGLYCACDGSEAPQQKVMPAFVVGPSDDPPLVDTTSSSDTTNAKARWTSVSNSPGQSAPNGWSAPFASATNANPSLTSNQNPELSSDRTAPITREIFAAGRVAQAEPEKLIGKTIGDGYLIIEFIGKGLSGHVFKVCREGLSGFFALKIVTPSLTFSKRHNNRFLQEAKLAKELDHHNIIALYDAGVTDDLVPYLVTDFFEGDRLSDVLKSDGPFEQNDAIDVFMQICDGLVHAHYMGIIHRDVKPSNVRVHDEDDGSKLVKLVDCGVSKVLPDPSRETRYFTENGFEYGDARYMSPEQCRGTKTDHRSDIYSLGCLMYQCLSGKTPFSADRTSMLIYKHVKKRPRTLSSRFPDLRISRDLENLVMRCLEKEPDDRYQSVSDLREDLLAIRAKRNVKRAFRKKLHLPDRKESSLVPEAVSATISATWFGFSSTVRLIAIALTICLVIGITMLVLLRQQSLQSPSIMHFPSQSIYTPPAEQLITIDAFESRIERLKQHANQLCDSVKYKNDGLASQIQKFLLDVEKTETSRINAIPHWTAADENAAIDRLQERLTGFTMAAGHRGLPDANVDIPETNVIKNANGDTIFVAPPGFSNAEALVAAIKAQVDLTGADLSNCALNGITIGGANLEGANFTSCDLRGATIKDTNLTGAVFNYAAMDHSRFSTVNLKDSTFLGTTLTGSTLVNTGLEGASLRYALLNDVDFLGGNMHNTELSSCNMDNLMTLDTGSTFKLDATPQLKELTDLKSSMEDKFERLADVKLVAQSLETGSGNEEDAQSLKMPGSARTIKLATITPDFARTLEDKVDKASASCQTVMNDARQLRRAQIISTKAKQTGDISDGLKRIKAESRTADANVAAVDKELQTILQTQPDSMKNEPPIVQPSSQKPLAEKPAKQKQTKQKRGAEKPTTGKPGKAKNVVQEKPAREKPAPEKPTTEKPAPEKPAPEKPAPEKPAPEKPAPEKPAPEKPAPEKPSPEKPAM